MDFAQTSAKTAMDFESGEASKARDWSKNMSNTAYQRATKDLVAAGLNPILAANSAASVGQSSSASGKSASSFKSCCAYCSRLRGAVQRRFNRLLAFSCQIKLL